MCSIPLVIIYPLMKRYTNWPQLVLGATFNWGVWVGWASVMHEINFPILLPLYVAGISWTIFYDTIYAHQDMVDDARIGVKSTALRFGDNSKRWLTGFACATVANLSLCGHMAGLGYPYQLSVAAVSLHFAWQLAAVDLTSRPSCMTTFIANVQVGFIILIGIIAAIWVKQVDTTNKDANSAKKAVVEAQTLVQA